MSRIKFINETSDLDQPFDLDLIDIMLCKSVFTTEWTRCDVWDDDYGHLGSNVDCRLTDDEMEIFNAEPFSILRIAEGEWVPNPDNINHGLFYGILKFENIKFTLPKTMREFFKSVNTYIDTFETNIFKAIEKEKVKERRLKFESMRPCRFPKNYGDDWPF